MLEVRSRHSSLTRVPHGTVYRLVLRLSEGPAHETFTADKNRHDGFI